ncbi:universal stress protein [Arthrobacter sp. Soil763]|uniref:universal stress protein n=1 Tax=Arthrobacter sp. Soil763 TaxID=1736402 RepID=UPI0006F276B9|nr:universal stress protein [Arthrobacter sp. Soil763]KRE78672.1 universal stress protein UspA [Arthrobacter sp. Soil763]
MAAEETFRIVVGVDGSGPSLAALHWALKEARLRSGQVHIVTAWHYPVIGDAAGRAPDHEAFGESARLVHAEALRQADGAGVPVTGGVVEGHPAHALLRAAEDADLLVVGSRGHGGFADMLLGSVSSHAVHHARCPVLVVRAGGDQARR